MLLCAYDLVFFMAFTGNQYTITVLCLRYSGINCLGSIVDYLVLLLPKTCKDIRINLLCIFIARIIIGNKNTISILLCRSRHKGSLTTISIATTAKNQH